MHIIQYANMYTFKPNYTRSVSLCYHTYILVTVEWLIDSDKEVRDKTPLMINDDTYSYTVMYNHV